MQEDGGLGMRGGSDTGTAGSDRARQQKAAQVAQAAPSDSELRALQQVCKGHVWKLDAYGL